ncbi:VWA domain-containing protein [Granulicella aggregans]|nr:VWA domain-containing protein [Granulicella aggregans]
MAAGQVSPAQEADAPAQGISTINVRSTLVVVPALVKTKSGALVYTLTAKDFTLTDNGVEQKLTLEDDAGGQPLALLVVVETGGAGGRQLDNYRTLPAMLDGLLGGVPHKVGVVAFDGHPELVQKFTPHMDRVEIALNNLEAGDPKAATLDALAFAVKVLSVQPPEYRRAILLLSETIDHGSTTTLAEALRAVSDTNTVIYSAAFSSTRSDAKNEAKKFSQPDTPGPPGGCMAKDPEADPNIPENEVAKAFECLNILIPPIRAAKLAILAGIHGLSRNTPETVAHLTGGEYYKFDNVKSLEKDLATISNHIPNRYMLSFHPQSPQSGIHALELSLKDYPDLKVTARSSYWLEPENDGKP